MSLIYNVAIKPAEQANRFHITWHNPRTGTFNSFDQPYEITTEEAQRLWLWPQCQLDIGRKLFRFLDGDNRCFHKALNRANRQAKTLQLNLNACKQVVNWPFELLAKDGTFLLTKDLHLVRCVSDGGKAKRIYPKKHSLKLLFMACSAIDIQPELDFEREEEAIFHITRDLSIDMDVEDSGSLEGLRRQLEQLRYDVMHLSGHANVDKNGLPYFVMEDETGYEHKVYPGQLWNGALIKNPPQLLFLSGCRTGETAGITGTFNGQENRAEISFARWMAEHCHVPAVLGWGRTVRDKQAALAGKMLFQELSRGRSILNAVQRARYELIRKFPHSDKPAWPMLRLFSSGIPLNAFVKEGRKQQPKSRQMKHIYLKNSRVRVLAQGFVGRRRQLQISLRALKQDADKIGVVLLGTGGLGKSCLAGKICERFPNHTLIIVHGKLNTITLEAALKDAFIICQDHKGKQILSQKIEMKDKLIHLCSTSFKAKNYLLLLDDFEQNLEGSDKGQPGPLMLEASDLLNVMLRYLPGCGKMTQLMITSRYGFSLHKDSLQTSNFTQNPARRAIKNFSGGPGGRFYKKAPLAAGGNNHNLLKEVLEWVWLTGFQGSEQMKKARELENILYYQEQASVPQLLAAGHGNPRLLEWLDILVGRMPKANVSQLLAAVKNRQEDFIRDHVLRELLRQGGEQSTLFLRWFAIYRRPVLEEGARLAAEKAGVETWKQLLCEAISLSLVEHDQTRQSYQVTPLLREELLSDLREHQACHQAAFSYYRTRCEADESYDPLLVEEWIFHALGCGEEDVASDQGGKLVNYLRANLALVESRRVGEWILAKKTLQLGSPDDADLLNELASTMDDIGDYNQAIIYYEQALKIDITHHGEEYAHVASTLNNLGMAWGELGNYRKAAQYVEKAMNIDKKLYGKDHPSVAGEMHNLAWIWYSLGEHRKAALYYDKVLATFRRAYGEENHRVATTLMNLGLLWGDLGDYEKAVEYYSQALNINRKIYGDEHPGVAISLNNLGAAWHKLGDNEKALQYYNMALTIDRRVYGDNHQKAANNLNNQGAAWNGLGQLKKAADCYRQALEIYKGLYGDEYSMVAICLNNLGTVLGESGDHRKARTYYEKAYAIDRTVYGENHSNTARDLNNLGSVCFVLGELRQAISYFEQAYAIDREIYSEDHQTAARYFNNMGTCWLALDDFSQAVNYFEKALSIDRKIYGHQHPKLITDLNNLGLCRDKQGDYRSAVDYFQQALVICLALYDEIHPDTATTLINLGSAIQDLGECHKAIEYYEHALKIVRAVYGESHPHSAVVFNNLGSAYDQLGDHHKAADYYMKALAIDQKIYDDKHPAVSRELNNLGTVSGKLGDHRKAIEYFRKSLAIERKLNGEKHSNVAIRLNNMGLSWDVLGEHKKAIACFRQAIAIERKVFGETHHNIAKLLNRMGAAYFQLKQIEKAKTCFKKAYEMLCEKFGTEHPQTKIVAYNLDALEKQ